MHRGCFYHREKGSSKKDVASAIVEFLLVVAVIKPMTAFRLFREEFCSLVANVGYTYLGVGDILPGGFCFIWFLGR